MVLVRYRLWEVERVLNKALVYGVLAAFISAVYVAIVVGVGRAVGSGDRQNLGLSILATAVVAVAFASTAGLITYVAWTLLGDQKPRSSEPSPSS